MSRRSSITNSNSHFASSERSGRFVHRHQHRGRSPGSPGGLLGCPDRGRHDGAADQHDEGIAKKLRQSRRFAKGRHVVLDVDEVTRDQSVGHTCRASLDDEARAAVRGVLFEEGEHGEDLVARIGLSANGRGEGSKPLAVLGHADGVDEVSSGGEQRPDLVG
jgi:hypothetical protein